jgi:predicted small secreted protein
MKNKGILGLYVLLIGGFVLAACDTGTDAAAPTEVVRQFARALEKNDVALAGTYCTPESAFLLEYAAGFGEDLGTWGTAILNATLKETINSDTAQVNVKGGDLDESVNLVRQDGQWKLDLSSLM